MSGAELSKHDRILAGLVVSLQAATMQSLGKFKNPLNDQVERDLEQARGTIDILEMLKAKCRTDTAPEILRMLDTSVYELQMNYLDEVKKDSAERTGTDATDSADAAAETTAEPAAEPAAEPESAAAEGATATEESE